MHAETTEWPSRTTGPPRRFSGSSSSGDRGEGQPPNLIGLAILGPRIYAFGRILRSIEEAHSGQRLEVAVSGVDDVDAASVSQSVTELRRSHPRAMIVLTSSPTAARRFAEFVPDLPAVAVGVRNAGSMSTVTTDHHGGARLATEHLLAQGGETVWHVGGPEQSAEAREREQGWRDTLEDHDVRVPPVIRGDWSPTSGYAAGEILLRERSVDAIFVANDKMALGVYRAFADAGRPAPGDIRVAGFDDDPMSAYLTPSLTTVRPDWAALGASTVDLLSGNGIPGSRLYTPELVVRRSTAR